MHIASSDPDLGFAVLQFISDSKPKILWDKQLDVEGKDKKVCEPYVKILGRGVKMKYYFAAVSLLSQLSLEEVVRSMVTLCILFNCYSCLVQMCSYPSESGEIIEMGNKVEISTLSWQVLDLDQWALDLDQWALWKH
ncbi:uncharacterized protein DS421_12g372950 [Arachis hypogaea]|nr:uncharacterized protein DS421_12g372950 [Arachis hypogaea]